MKESEKEVFLEGVALISQFLLSKNLHTVASLLESEIKQFDFESDVSTSKLDELFQKHYLEKTKLEENKKKLELSLNEKKNTQYPFPISTPSLDKDEWDLGDDDAGYVYSIISEEDLEEELEGCYLDDQITTLRHESYQTYPNLNTPIPEEITQKIDNLLNEFPGEIETLVQMLGISYDGVIDRQVDTTTQIHEKLYQLLSSHFYEKSITKTSAHSDDSSDNSDDSDDSDSDDEKEVEYEEFFLKVIQQKGKTGFEMHKDYPIVVGNMIANRYQIEQFLGSAAFSRAIQCYDTLTNQRNNLVIEKKVCMKIITNNKDFFDQSLDEIKLLTLLKNNHNNLDDVHLLKIFDYFYHKEHLFLVTELLRDNLYEFYKYNFESGDELYFNLERLKIVTRQILIALQYLHSLNLIHCDLKPENILIKSYSRCEVKVIDVGSSCFITDHLSSYVQSRSYRAPEVILGLPYGQKVDLWSLGCIVAELFTGNVLFANDSATTLLARVNAVIGPIPAHLSKGIYYHKYYTNQNVLYERRGDNIIKLYPKPTTLKHRLKTDDPLFIDFVSRLLKIDPAQRPSSTEALAHPWLKS